jgi:hypothetical protein
VYGISDVRQIEIHTSEPLVPDPSPYEVEIATKRSKREKSPGSDQIPAELIQTGGEILCSKIHELVNFIWNKEELPDQWKESIIARVHKKNNKTVVITVGYHSYQLHTKIFQYPSLKVESINRLN